MQLDNLLSFENRGMVNGLWITNVQWQKTAFSTKLSQKNIIWVKQAIVPLSASSLITYPPLNYLSRKL